MNLFNTVSQKYQGMLVIGDIHSMHVPLVSAVAYATHHNLFLVMLGDLVDGGNHPEEVLDTATAILSQGIGALIIGNHDEKYYRLSLGNPVQITPMIEHTLNSAYSDKEEFLQKYATLLNGSLASYYLHYATFMFVHGAPHKSLWEFPGDITNEQRVFALRGYVSGERDENDFPIRTYEWLDDIPSGHSTVVGHSRDALGKHHLVPSIEKGALGGTAYFIDTGCGKTNLGVLTGAEILLQDGAPKFTKFVTFGGK